MGWMGPGRGIPDRTSSSAGAGAMLTARRRNLGWCYRDVACADGHWSEADVRSVELQAAPSASDVARYVRAIERLAAADYHRFPMPADDGPPPGTV